MLWNIREAWHRRGLPAGVRGLKCCQVSYSQFGEDLIADSVFGTRYSIGHYVDVGCFDPQKWSNTYRFYLKEWRGVCIDPNPEYGQLWRVHRPQDIFLNLAVSDRSGNQPYVKSTVLPQENRLAADGVSYGTGCSTVMVKTDRLDRILAAHYPAGTTIDLMSVDCEGHDLVVLQSNDFERFRPRVLIIEDHKRNTYSKIDEFCESHEYQLVGFTAVSKLFADTGWITQRKGNLRREILFPAISTESA